jgi:hypothetical protein
MQTHTKAALSDDTSNSGPNIPRRKKTAINVFKIDLMGDRTITEPSIHKTYLGMIIGADILGAGKYFLS